MEKIKIRKNPFGDTRSAPKDTDFVSFSEATDWHRSDVRRVMEMSLKEIRIEIRSIRKTLSKVM